MEPEYNHEQTQSVTEGPDDMEIEEITRVYSVQPWVANTTRHNSWGSLAFQETRGTFVCLQENLWNHRHRCASADTIARPRVRKTARDEEDEAICARTWSPKRLRLSIPERTDSVTSSYTTCPDCSVTDPPPDTGTSLDTSAPEVRNSKERCNHEPTSPEALEKPWRPPEERGRNADRAEQKRVPADPERLKHRARRRKTTCSPHHADWSSLPNVALIKIYRCLGHADRLNMSTVCSRWRRAFFSPTLWRRAVLRPTSRGFLFAKLLGTHVRKMKLICESVWSPAVFKSMLESLKNASLTDLEFVDFAFGLGEWPGRKTEILGALEEFAASQSGLSVAKFGQMELTREEGCRLIAALPPSLAQLGIEVLFAIASSSAPPVFEDAMFWNCLHRFQQLQELRVAYDCIDDQRLSVLGGTPMGRQLWRLSLHLYEDTSRRHVIQSATWRQLTSANPRLQVRVHAEDVDEAGLRRVLVWGLPLHSLELMYTGDTDPEHEANGVTSVLVHAAAHYPQLQEICLDDFTSQAVDEGLQRILSCCKSLVCFQFYGTMTKEGMENVFSLVASESFRSLCINLELVECQEESLLKDLAAWLRIVSPGVKLKVLLNSEDV